jgi:hypothetical protein
LQIFRDNAWFSGVYEERWVEKAFKEQARLDGVTRGNFEQKCFFGGIRVLSQSFQT